MIVFIDVFIDLKYFFDTNNGTLKIYKQIMFLHWYFLLIFLFILDIILIRILGFKSIQVNFIFYIWYFLLIFLLILLNFFIDLSSYFDTNNRFRSMQANFTFYLQTFNICFLYIIWNSDENLLCKFFMDSKLYIKNIC